VSFGFGVGPLSFTGEPKKTLLGFGCTHLVLTTSIRQPLVIRRDDYIFAVPIWFPIALFSVAPLRIAWRFIIRRRRQMRGLCVNCGYDLRATPERCPECGTAVLANARVAKRRG
jgi:hypothetical protein